MKIKLFRIISLLFVLSSAFNLMAIQPTYADAASDQQALNLIAQCSGKITGNPLLDPACGAYTNCRNLVIITDLCKSVRRLDSPNLRIPDDTVTKCVAQNHTKETCIANYSACLSSHLKNSKVSGADAKTCAATTAKGGFADNNRPNKAKEGADKCVIDGIGWILCPVATFMGLVVDGAYAFVSSLLTVQPLMTPANGNNDTAGAYSAWSIMRNFANVAFVIVFLIIILSQVSSIGITNYGIKKMLPRLIVAAVLVNVSYWICALAIDVSNIVGVSITDIFNNIQKTLPPPDTGAWSGGGKWQNIVGDVLAGTVAGVAIAAIALYATLSSVMVVLLPVLLAIVTTFLVLTLRQALIILLVVIAPLAFVAYLLPNTESYFKKWRGLLQTLLLMYPIIALIFGASAIASNIVMASADGTYKIAVQIMGAAIAILPLALTPIIMKFSGGILNRFGGIINNPNKGPYDRLRKKAEGYRDYRKDVNKANRLGRAGKLLSGEGGIGGAQYSRRRRIAASIGSGGATNAINKAQKEGFAKAIGDESAQQYFAERAIDQEGFASSIAGGSELKGAGLQASAQAAVDKIFKQDVANREILLRADVEFKDNPAKALAEAIASGNKIQAVAAQNLLFQSGSSGISKFREVVEKAESDPGMSAGLEAVQSQLKTNVKEQHGKYAKEKGADVVKWASDSAAKLSATTYGQLSDSELVGQHESSMVKMANNNDITKEQANKILGDDRLNANLNPQQRNILENVAGRGTPAPNQLNILHENANAENARRNSP